MIVYEKFNSIFGKKIKWNENNVKEYLLLKENADNEQNKNLILLNNSYSKDSFNYKKTNEFININEPYNLYWIDLDGKDKESIDKIIIQYNEKNNTNYITKDEVYKAILKRMKQYTVLQGFSKSGNGLRLIFNFDFVDIEGVINILYEKYIKIIPSFFEQKSDKYHLSKKQMLIKIGYRIATQYINNLFYNKTGIEVNDLSPSKIHQGTNRIKNSKYTFININNKQIVKNYYSFFDKELKKIVEKERKKTQYKNIEQPDYQWTNELIYNKEIALKISRKKLKESLHYTTPLFVQILNALKQLSILYNQRKIEKKVINNWLLAFYNFCLNNQTPGGSVSKSKYLKSKNTLLDLAQKAPSPEDFNIFTFLNVLNINYIEKRNKDILGNSYNKSIKLNSQYLEYKTVKKELDTNNNIILKAPTGAGKTTIITNYLVDVYLNKKNKKNLLFLAPVNLISEQVEEKFYKILKEKNLSENIILPIFNQKNVFKKETENKIIISNYSNLCKFKDVDFELIIIDEVHDFVNFSAFADTYILPTSSKKIFVSATPEFFLIGENKEDFFYLNFYNKYNEKKKVNIHLQKPVYQYFNDKIKDVEKDNKKICIYNNSHEKLKNFDAKIISSKTKDKSKEYNNIVFNELINNSIASTSLLNSGININNTDIKSIEILSPKMDPINLYQYCNRFRKIGKETEINLYTNLIDSELDYKELLKNNSLMYLLNKNFKIIYEYIIENEELIIKDNNKSITVLSDFYSIENEELIINKNRIKNKVFSDFLNNLSFESQLFMLSFYFDFSFKKIEKRTEKEEKSKESTKDTINKVFKAFKEQISKEQLTDYELNLLNKYKELKAIEQKYSVKIKNISTSKKIKRNEEKIYKILTKDYPIFLENIKMNLTANSYEIVDNENKKIQKELYNKEIKEVNTVKYIQEKINAFLKNPKKKNLMELNKELKKKGLKVRKEKDKYIIKKSNLIKFNNIFEKNVKTI